MTRHFLTTLDRSPGELEALIAAAAEFRSGARTDKPLAGRSVALIFFDPSLRTRTSMQVGIYDLGGNAVVLEPGKTSWTIEHRDGVVMDGDKTEHIREFVGVLERYVSAIGVRTFAGMKDWADDRTDPILNAIARYSRVPVINLESAMHHPCQALADAATIRQVLGSGKKRVLLTWAWHPKPLPMAVPNSFALAMAQFGHDVVIAHPPGYELDSGLIERARTEASASGGSVEVTGDVPAAYDGVEVVYAKSWGSSKFYGSPERDIAHRADLRQDWIVDADKMRRSNDAIFMHCLPVRRNVVVSDAVIDSPRSVIFDEAENRLHVQKAILADLFK